jgi:hypothetical protein
MAKGEGKVAHSDPEHSLLKFVLLTLGTGSTSHFQSQTFNHFLKIPVWA